MSESPEVAAAREAYAKACEDFCDPILLLMEPPGYAKERLFAARKALDAALLTQRDRESGVEEVIGLICATTSKSRVDFWAETARAIKRDLGAAGWRLVRSEPAQAPEAKASPNGQQGPVQGAKAGHGYGSDTMLKLSGAKAGVYCDECGQALR